MAKGRAKKIAIELYDVYNRNVGLGEFTWQLATHIAQRAKELNESKGIKFYFIVPKSHVGAFGNDVRYVAMNKHNRICIRYSMNKYDIFHATHQCSRVKYKRSAKCNILTIHDLNYIYEKSALKILKYDHKLSRVLRHANALTFISEFARHSVAERFPIDKMPSRVIYNGVADLCSNRADISKYNLPKGYLFHISSLMPKKNVHLLIEMMRYLPNEHLAIVGNWNSSYGKELINRIEELGLKNITTLSHITNDEKAEMYRSCRAFCFPSLCEGFGLPPIEAMRFGKPVFLSAYTSLPEIGGDQAYYFEELEPEVMAKSIEKGLSDFDANQEQKSKMLQQRADFFNWDKCADEYINLYLEFLEQ